MTSLDQHKEALNQAGLEMLELCGKQMHNAREVLFANDTDLAEEVLRTENMVNALELKIDRDSERFIALHHPLASDLRFVLALMKINFNLERMGDHACGISKYVVDIDTAIDKKLLETVQINEMFETCLSMFDDITDAFTDAESQRARKVFKKDKILDKINIQAFSIISTEIKKDAILIDQFLLLFSIIKKIERMGDHMTNIAEEIIFFREAEVLKHRKKKRIDGKQ